MNTQFHYQLEVIFNLNGGFRKEAEITICSKKSGSDITYAIYVLF